MLFTGPQAEQLPPVETVTPQVTEAHRVSYRSHDLQSAWFAGGLVLKVTKKLHLSNDTSSKDCFLSGLINPLPQQCSPAPRPCALSSPTYEVLERSWDGVSLLTSKKVYD